jgi:hypothetical protein
MPAGCEEVSVLLALICGSGISTDAVVSPLTHPYSGTHLCFYLPFQRVAPDPHLVAQARKLEVTTAWITCLQNRFWIHLYLSLCISLIIPLHAWLTRPISHQGCGRNFMSLVYPRLPITSTCKSFLRSNQNGLFIM